MGDITVLIQQAQAGDADAAAQLFEQLYPDLRRVARARLAGHQRNTLLDTTALVHECFLKLHQAQRLQNADRRHFMAYASRAMRSVIVDFARERLAERRGGGQEHVPIDTTMAERIGNAEDEILDVHAALEQLAAVEPRLAQVVEMRYFGGLTEVEIGEALGLTERTVRRDWNKARLLLLALLADG